MKALHIQLFGEINRVARNNEAVTLQPTVFTFLAYLLLNRKRYHCREVLSELFWGEREEGQARRCLSTTLWRLRQELEPKGTPRGTYILTTHSGDIGFNVQTNGYWLDVAAFEEKVELGFRCQPSDMTQFEVTQLEEAVRLYTGDLLEGVYHDWVLHHRERLRIHYLKCLSRLMQYYSQVGNCEQGLNYGRKILALDPMREEVHREMMRLYDRNGERSQAIQQYKYCSQVLAKELLTEPAPETQAVYKQLLMAHVPLAGNPTIVHATQPIDLQQALQQLDYALLNLEEMRGQLHRAREAIIHFLK